MPVARAAASALRAALPSQLGASSSGEGKIRHSDVMPQVCRRRPSSAIFPALPVARTRWLGTVTRGSSRNSRRVLASSRNAPRRQLVTIFTPCLWTPRVVMHSWEASMTTPTPRGWSTSWTASATWRVSFSWIWSR